MKNFYHRAWAEINLDVLKNNIEIIRNTPETAILSQ